MAKYGLKIAQKNKDTETGLPQELVFSTDFSTLPIYKIFSQDYSLTGGDLQTKRIKHELKFVPFGIMYFKVQGSPNKWKFFPVGTNDLVSLIDDIQPLTFRMDKENIIITLTNNSGSTRTITVKVIIFAFPVALSI